ITLLVVDAAAGEGGVEIQVARLDDHFAGVVKDAATDGAGRVLVERAIVDIHLAAEAVDAAAVLRGGVKHQGGGFGGNQVAPLVVHAAAGVGMVVNQGAGVDPRIAALVVQGAAQAGAILIQEAALQDHVAAVDVDGDGAAAAVRGVEIRLGERHRQNAPVVVDAAAGDFGEVLIHNTSVDIQEPLEVVDAAALLHFPVGASITVKAVV